MSGAWSSASGRTCGRQCRACQQRVLQGKDDVRIVFDGAGTAWVPELAKKEHKAHGLYAAVGDRIAGVCAYCAGAFGVKDAVVAQGVQLAGEYEGHPSVRRLVHDGYQVITF